MDSPIFIIGSCRSGTTLLRNMLNAHPRIHIAFEPQFYWYRALFRRRRPAREFLDYYFQTPHFRWQRVDPARVLAQLPSPLTRDHLGLAFAAVLREKAARFGRVRFGDKTPAHTSALEQIYADFPEAKAIHIIRDPRATVVSLSKMPWAPPSLLINATYLEQERKYVKKFHERMLHVRLEDLLADPHATMTRVLDFVGEPWDDAVLDHASHQPGADDTPPYPWLERATRPRANDAPSTTWPGLTPVQIRMIERVTRKVMANAGYAKAELAKEPRWASVFWAGIREIPQFFRFAAVGLPILFRARDPKNLDEMERELMRRMNPRAWDHYPGFTFPSAPPLRALPE